MADLAPMLENGFSLPDEHEERKKLVIQMVFKNINVKVKEKHLLQDVSGVAEAGKLLAIMGPSGSGKTTLLNVLAGRATCVSGQVTLNRQPLNKQLMRKVCYVLQDDIFFPGLTLRETLNFATWMRLPDYMPKEEKRARLDEIVNLLDIQGCLDTVMGDTLVRGLSGGEKKRATIACELITDPAIILLDEPTSGLDYSSAFNLITTLKRYTVDKKKMVVMAIHQPSSRIFYQFDKLMLLSGGELAYFGNSENVISFFAGLDLPMSEHYNPAEFILEKLKEDDRVRRKIVDAAFALRDTEEWPPVLRVNTDSGLIENEVSPTTSPKKSKTASLKVITHSPIYKKISKRVKRGDPKFDPNFDDTGSMNMLNFIEDKEKWPTGFFTQFKQLTVRTFKNSRARLLSRLQLIEATILCVLVSLLWFQLPRTEETIRDRMGVIFFIAIHWSFKPLFDAVSSFPSEKVVIQKERAAGWYRLSAYYFAKIVSEMPLIVFAPTLFIILAYWCVGLNGVGPFFATIFTVMLGAFCGQSVGLFLGIACMDFQKAASVATCVMMAFMLLGGFYNRHLPGWLDWIKYLTFIHYTFHGLMVIEFSGDWNLKCASAANTSQFSRCSNPNVTAVTSQEVLSYLDIKPSYSDNIFPLIFFIFLFHLLGYIILRFVYKPKPVQISRV